MIIDVHTHFLPLETMGAAGSHGPEIGRASSGRPFLRVSNWRMWDIELEGQNTFTDADARVREMDERGIDMHALSASAHTYLYWIPVDLTEQFARAHNDATAQAVKKHPDRLIGLATLPLQETARAVRELERAIGDLGLHGFSMGTNIAGMNMDDERLFPVYEKAEELDVPIFVHPHHAGAAGEEDERLKKYELALWIGFLAEESIGIASLIFGGVLESFPKLKLYFSHGGGMVPYQLGRLAAAAQLRPEAKEKLRRPFQEYFSRLYFDCILHRPESLQFLIDTVGVERVLYGTNHDGADHFNGLEVLGKTRVKAKEREKILSENAKSLFKLK